MSKMKPSYVNILSAKNRRIARLIDRLRVSREEVNAWRGRLGSLNERDEALTEREKALDFKEEQLNERARVLRKLLVSPVLRYEEQE